MLLKKKKKERKKKGKKVTHSYLSIHFFYFFLKHKKIMTQIVRFILQDTYLALSSFVSRIQLNNLLEVSSCPVKLFHTAQCFSPSEQSLLIWRIQLQSLWSEVMWNIRANTLYYLFNCLNFLYWLQKGQGLSQNLLMIKLKLGRNWDLYTVYSIRSKICVPDFSYSQIMA